MHTLTSFKVGETYTNDQIRFSLDLENLGGIRPALDPQGNLRHVAIMTATEDSGRLSSENPYHDRIEGGVLIYTAQGREGDQALAGRNKRLLEQYASPTPFFGFVNIGRQTYRFLGLLELLRHYQENQSDTRGNLRKVWLFEFRIHEMPEVIPINEALSISASILTESRRINPLGSPEREIATVTEGIDEVTEQTVASIEAIRARMFQFSPHEFEHFIKIVLERNGFVNVTVTRASGDGGIDANAYVAEEDNFFRGNPPAGPGQAVATRGRQSRNKQFQRSIEHDRERSFHYHEPLHSCSPSRSTSSVQAFNCARRRREISRDSYSQRRPVKLLVNLPEFSLYSV